MNTDRLPWLLLMIALAALAWTAKGASEWRAVADVHASEAASDKLRADSLHALSESKTALADSLARTYTADSTRWAAERAENAERAVSGTRRATEASEVARAAEIAVDSATTVFRAALPPEHVEPFESLMAAVDRRDAAKDTTIVAQADVIEAQADDLTTEREDNAALRVRVTTLTEGMGVLTEENGALRDENASLYSANESLRRGLASVDRQKRLLTLGAAGLTGYVLYTAIKGG